MKSISSSHVLALDDLAEVLVESLAVVTVHIHDFIVELYSGVCCFEVLIVELVVEETN